jgi:hypothetical protein
MNHSFQAFKQKIARPISFRLFLFMQVPSAFFAGLKIVSLSEEQSIICVRQKWFNKNPFRSIYFAILSMAAEISTGILCMGYLYKSKPAVSMLVVQSEAKFVKKATGKILFYCNDGNKILSAINAAIQTGQSQTFASTAIGKNEQGDVVAEFIFTWGFKAKQA